MLIISGLCETCAAISAATLAWAAACSLASRRWMIPRRMARRLLMALSPAIWRKATAALSRMVWRYSFGLPTVRYWRRPLIISENASSSWDFKARVYSSTGSAAVPTTTSSSKPLFASARKSSSGVIFGFCRAWAAANLSCTSFVNSSPNRARWSRSNADGLSAFAAACVGITSGHQFWASGRQ